MKQINPKLGGLSRNSFLVSCPTEIMSFTTIPSFEYACRGGSRTAATFKMEPFMITVNGFQPLIIITKCSILNVAVILDPPLRMHILHLVYTNSLTDLCFNLLLPGFPLLHPIKNIRKTRIFRGVLKKRCFENMQQIYRRTLMSNFMSNPLLSGVLFL